METDGKKERTEERKEKETNKKECVKNITT